MECMNNIGLLSGMKVKIKEEDQWLDETETELAHNTRTTLELVPVLRIKKEPVSEVNDADEDPSSQSPRSTSEQGSQAVGGPCTSLTHAHSGENSQVGTDTKPLKCDLCEKSFKQKQDLHHHMHSHARPYKCDLCEKSFKQKQDLHHHMHSHARPYKCVLCENSFKLSLELKQHMQQKHADAKPYKCDKCEKSFKWESLLKQHMDVHSDARPYKCETCQKCFKWKSTVYQHIWLHSNT